VVVMLFLSVITIWGYATDQKPKPTNSDQTTMEEDLLEEQRFRAAVARGEIRDETDAFIWGFRDGLNQTLRNEQRR
jgi:hypothetical protein